VINPFTSSINDCILLVVPVPDEPEGIAAYSLGAACIKSVPLPHLPVETVHVFPVPQSTLTLHAQIPAVHNVLKHSDPLLQLCPTAFASELIHL